MANTENIRDSLLGRIDSFLQEAKLSDSAFGRQAVGDHKFIRRLRDGFGVTLTSIEKAESFMRDYSFSDAAARPAKFIAESEEEAA